MCIGETLWVPLCTYEHPNGVLIPDPLWGPVTLRFSFRSRTFSLRLPGSLTTPKGWYHTPKGCDNETFNAYTRVSCNFGQFEPFFSLNLRVGFVAKIVGLFFRIGSLRGLVTPSGSNFVAKIVNFSHFNC